MNKRNLAMAVALGLLLPLVAGAAPQQSAPAAPAPSTAPKAKVAADGDPIGPAQASVASKTALFGTLPAANPAAAKAMDAHNLADAQKLVGKTGAFQGTVTQAYSPEDHDKVILDFDKEYKTALTAVVLPGDYAKFPDLSTLAGKHVLVSGTFSAPKGKPLMMLTSPAQVKIIQ